ncbi:T9SS type B sorting domain-containing protein [Flavobacterium bizetiae]|uniref:T9SS type B sorting domain-containing protein n=1 Tax=Flavobacterium bizetiae TaxID=2704140 RepID=UPI0021E90B6F|nr:T9SS type B sorting domain-containing protein [Flavobacterium bizetiae]UTN05268.1 T9SS type B sorting domain-containing protein [Flavobacterium bizetiae]
MRKPTILRTLIFVLAMLFNFASYSQNGIAYNSKFPKNLNENIFLKANNQFENPFSLDTNTDPNKAKVAVPAIENPVIKYAQGEYAGVVSECPNDGKKLPKLFLCGKNDSRLIKTGITDAISIQWERRTGGCAPNLNGNCANDADNCTWADVASGPDYNASAAGEFRVKIRYADKTEFIFYFNVYTNEVDPTGIIKSDIVKDGTGCVIPGQIIAGGFGAAYEYSFTTNPDANTWQDSNTFQVTKADKYNVFIRLRGITGSCIFNVKGIVVSEINFASTVVETQPACNGEKGSVIVRPNTLNNQFVYQIFKDTDLKNAIATGGPKSIAEHEFTGLADGNYVIVTTIEGTCATDTQKITIKSKTKLLNNSSITTTMNDCSTGIITGGAAEGTSPYNYYVNIDNAGFVLVPNGKVIVSKGGTYIMRVTDLNGCTADKTFVIANSKKPEYTITTTTSGSCNPTGNINITIVNKNGYNTIEYSKDFGKSWQTSTSSYKNLVAGEYNVAIRYGVNGISCTDAFTVVNIGTTTALTASAGVAALAGCAPDGVKGIVRITNPQGGTAPYEYWFNSTDGWQKTNEGYLPEGGPYTVVIRDKSLCTYEMGNIYMDAKPTAPKIERGPLVFNCDGTANQSVIINGGAGDPRYTFQYYIDGYPNPNTAQPNVFLNIPQGQHFITVDYNVKSATTSSNLLTETFGSGENTTSPGINTFYYCFERQIQDNSQSATWCNGSPAINDGDYSVTSYINQTATSGWNWMYPKDNTSKGKDPKGRFLAVNIGDKIPVTTILYEKQINDVIPNQPINFEFYAMNLMMIGKGKADANLRIALVDDSGTEISWFATGPITRSNNDLDWQKFPKTAITLDPGAHTSLRFIVRSNVRDDNGNDVAIDDIKVYQVPRVCGAQFKWDFTINAPPKFIGTVEGITPVSCFGSKDGAFTIKAENFDTTNGYEYSIDGGVKWYTSKVAEVKFPNATFPDIVAKTYDIRIRYNKTATDCSYTIPTIIKSPDLFKLNVSATDATCSTKAIVTAKIEGGTGPTYAITLTNTADGTKQPFVVDPVDGEYKVRDVLPGNYTVSGVDGKNCPASQITNLKVNGPVAIKAEIDASSNLCFNATTGASIVVKIIGGKGKFQYKVRFNGGNYSELSDLFDGPTFTYPVSKEGIYDFIIVDANGCSADAVSQTISPVFAAKPSIKAALSCKAGAAAAATILVTIEGGAAPFNYIVKNSLGTKMDEGTTTTSTFEFTTTISDTYTFEIVDFNKCPIKILQKISDKIQVTAEAKPNNATCFGTKNGYVDLKGLTGVAPYTFEFNGTGGFSNKTHYDGLEGSVAGIDYTFIVKDANECTKSYSFKIYQPEDISGKAEISTAYTCDHAATITVSEVKGGTPQYKYTLLLDNVAVAGPQDGLTFSNLSIAGEYKVVISDANSCSKTITVGTITALNKPASMKIDHSLVTCPTNRSTITITDVKNAAGTILTTGLEYRMVSPTAGTFSTNNTFTNLAADVEYTFEVRDANNCKVQDKHFIPLPKSFTVGSKSTPVSCFTGSTDGTATFTITGIDAGTGYTYQVDALPLETKTSTGSPFDIVITGLAAGDHKIVVTNSTTNCPVTEIVKVQGPTAALALNAPDLTHVTCKDQGTATINAVDGWGTYTYTVTRTLPLPAGAAKVQVNNNKFINLAPGTYSVSVSDLRGCTVAGQTFLINDFVKPSAQISVNTIYCAGGLGATLIAEPTSAPNPNPNYEYKLNSGSYQPSGTFKGLIPGDYTITVRDIVTGCTDVLAKQTIAQPLSATPRIEADLTCDPTSPEAKIEVSIFNGYPDYKYRVNTTGVFSSEAYINVSAGQTKFSHSVLEGTYYFEITDSKGCTVIVSQKVDATVKPDFTTDKVDVKCKGDNTGTITVNATPALGTYTYVLNTVPATVEVTQTTNIFKNLKAGKYSIYVIDAKKCKSDAKTVDINEPSIGLTVDAKVTTELLCDASNNAKPAKITVTVTGGTPFPGINPYRYSYNGVMPPVVSNVYTTTDSGTVTVQVFDANNCSLSTPIDVEIKGLKSPTALSFSQDPIISCKSAEKTTDLKVTVTNGVAPFKFEITSTDAAIAPANPVVTGIATQDHIFLGLYPGNYHFKITDNNGCTVVDEYYVKPVDPINAVGGIVTNVTCNGLSDGVVKFTISGNTTGGYTFGLVSSASPTNIVGNDIAGVVTYTGLKGGLTYTFTVTNTATGCTATDEVILGDPDAITIVKADGTKVFCSKPKTNITVTATGGTGTLNYAVVKQGVTPVAGDYNTTGLFEKDTDVDGINYDVYVTDGKGCPIQSTITIPRDAKPTIDPITAPMCYSGTNFTVKIVGTVYNGTPLYGLDGSYDTNDTKTITGPGTYTLSIMDDHGCEAKTNITINSILTLKHVLDKDITCSAPAAAQVTLTAGGGNNSYTYDYKLETTGTYAPVGSNVFNTTASGNYYFKVTSGGCSTEIGPIKVTDPETPTASAIKTDPNCFNVSEGTITVTASGGVPGYQYRINGGTWQDSPVFTDLAATVAPGTIYSFQVKDSKGCISVSKDITLIQPSKIALEKTIVGITCNTSNGVSLGSITIDKVTGGTSPYNYFVTGTNYYKEFKNVPGTSAVFEIVDFGLYEIRITDAKGCVYTEEVTITSPPDDLDITVNAPPPADCSALGSAVVAVGVNTSIPIGNGPFYFSYYTGVKPKYPTVGVWVGESPAKQATITGLIPGVRYTFIVYDSHSGCYYYETAEIPIPSNTTLSVSAPTSQNVTCKGNGDGKVTFNVTSIYSSPTPITYEVYDALSLAPTGITGSGTVPANGTLAITGFGAMPYGDYFVLVKEGAGATNAGCSLSTAKFSIRESAVLLSADYVIVQNDNCNPAAGIIKVIGSDGTGPYNYMVTTTPGTPAATDPAWTTSPIFNRDSANYYAWVKDAFGCIKGTPVFLLPLDPSPTIDLSVPNLCAVAGAFEIKVDLTNSATAIAPFYISINNNTSYTLVDSFPYLIQNLSPGHYDIYVKDKNSCEVLQSIDIIPTPKLKVVTKQLDCSVATPNASIDVTITDGTAPFKYEVKKGAAAYSAPVSLGALDRNFSYPIVAADADTYIIRVTDANNCPIVTNPIVIKALVPIVPDSEAIIAKCYGGAGTIILSAIGGQGPYKFNFNNLGFSDENTYSVTALTSTTYPFVVKDALECEVTGSVVLGAPTEVKLDPAKVTQFTCGAGNAAQPAKVELSATGGTGVYEYSFDGSDFDDKTIYTVNEADADRNIPYAVRDANGCIDATGTVLIPKLVKPSNFDINLSGPITCTTLFITATITNVIGRTGAAYTYATIAPSPIVTTSATGVFNGLTPGNYVFLVTDVDTGCTKQLSKEIKEVIKINIEEQSLTDITCFGADNGKASFLVTGFGTATYTYQLDTNLAVAGPADGKIDLTNLTPGNHKITVFDNATNCSMFLDFEIESPAELLVIDKTVTPLGCTTDGKVVITADKGWGSYLFTLTEPDGTVLPVQTDGDFGGLKKVGVYNFSVQDAKGCILTDTFELFTPIEPVASIDISSVYCYTGSGVGQGATIVVNATTLGTPAYTPSYQYSIDNGKTWQGNTFTDVAPGDYQVTVRDQFGCKAVTPVSVKINSQLLASATKEKELYCTGTTDGIIKLEAAGGYPAYSYTVTKDLTTTTGPFTFDNPGTTNYIVTASGSYKFTVTDTEGCSFDIPAVEMVAPSSINFDAVPTSPNCIEVPAQGDASNGQILVTLTGVTENTPYTYTLTRTAPTTGTPVVQTGSGLFTGLIAGMYEVTVESEKDCPLTKSNIEITAPIPVEAKAVAAKFECTQPANAIKRTIVTVTGDGGTGSGTGAVSDYTYSDGTGWYLSNEFTVDAPKTPQTYTYYVKDKNGCVDDVQIIINPFPVLDSAKAELFIAADCPNLGVETIKVDIAGGTGAFEYQVSIDGAAYSTPATAITTGSTFNYLAPAGHSYQFKITDVNTLCTILTNVHDVPLYNTMKVFATASSQVTCNGLSDGAITINIENYTKNYNYDVLLGGVSVANGTGINATTNNPFTITGLAAGVNYIVKVTQTDYPSCDVDSNPVTITQPDLLDITGIDIKVENQNCNEDGTITVDPNSIVGGTRNYKFAILPITQAVTDADYSEVATKSVKTLKVGPADFDTWVVYVKDANGCPQSKQVNISLDPLPTITNVKVLNQCPTTDKYEIEVTADGLLKLQYSLDGVIYQDSNILEVNAPGDYKVWVWDKNQCPVTAPVSVTVLKPLTLYAEVKLPICKNSDGVITLFADGGTVSTPSSYVYTKNGGAPQPSNQFAGLGAGIYVFRVTDIVTGCYKEIKEEITLAADIIDAVATPRKTSCKGTADGGISVSLSAANINPQYVYSISGMGITPIVDQTSPEFNNLRSGNYTITVKSGRGCELQLVDVFVPEPDAIIVTASNTDFECTPNTNTNNNAIITVDNVTGGSGKYVTYQFMRDGVEVQSGDSKTYTQTDHLVGNYVVNVYDSNGCLGSSTAPISVAPFATLLDITFDVTPITCVTPETIQAIVATKGTLTAPLQYTLTGTDVNGTAIAPVVNNDGKFTVGIGNYLVTVLNTATHCTISQNHQVLDPNTFGFQVNAIRADICYGESTGNVELTLVDNRPYPADEAGAFRYTITGPMPLPITGKTTNAGPLQLTGLLAGRYEVVATLENSPGCDVRTTFDIGQPSTPLKSTVTHTRITCASANSDDGTINVFAEGGWEGTYQYELVGPVSYDYSEFGYFQKLTPGDYTVNARDSKGCIVSEVVHLVIPDAITFNAAATSTVLTCYGDNSGVITVTNPQGGEGANYVYSLSYTMENGEIEVLGPQELNVFTGLSAGTYTVSVSDSFSCETIMPTTITLVNPAKVEAELSLKDNITCLTDATLTLTATGGTGPYTYSEDGTTYSVPFNNSTTFSVAVGTHRYFVKDNLGCVSVISNDVKIEPVVPLAIELDLRNATVNCTGEFTAMIVAKATGGLGNYQYSLLNGAGVEIRPAQADGIFAALNAADGPYTVHVVSGDCTQNSTATTVTEPVNPLTSNYDVVPVKCFGEKNGAIKITASGGTGVIKYAISPYLDQFVESGDFQFLEAGFYTVIVQDILGCNVIYKDIEIKEPTVLIASEIPNSMIPEICKDDKDGAFFIQIKGGTAPYFESLDNEKGPYLPVTGLTKDYLNQVGGTHNVYIKDSNGCTSKVEIRMPEPVILNPTFDINYDCVNNSQSNMVTVTVDKSNTDLSQVDYALDSDVGPFQPSNIFTNVAPGKHYIVARHTNGCKVPTASFDIKAYDPLTLIKTPSKEEMNILSVTAAGGAPGYEYSFNGEPFTSSNKYKIYKTADYIVIVRDRNGCTATITLPGIYTDICLDNYFTPGGATNTTWGPGCTNIYNNLEFSIFDRYGRVIAKYHYGQKWDGRYNGADLPSGDYWYVLKLNDAKDDREFVGHFTLYR